MRFLYISKNSFIRIGDELSWRGSGIVTNLRYRPENQLVQYTASLFDKIQSAGHYIGMYRYVLQ